MGKAKCVDDATFPVDAKTALALEPEERAEWLSTACRLAKQGAIKVTQLYDVLARDKFSADLPDKVGVRMLRTLQKHMRMFSEKQQRFLSQSSLVVQYEALKENKASRGGAPAEAGQAASAHTSPANTAALEEMMARCRSFVRENAGAFEERQRAAQEAELAAKLSHEWAQIELWHRPLEAWEKAHMTTDDWRLHFLLVDAEEQKHKAIERWRKESQEMKREEDKRRRQEDERAILEEQRLAEKRLITRMRWLQEEEELREAAQRKAEERQRGEERSLAEHRRRQHERERLAQQRWEEQQRRKEEQRRIDEERRRAEEQRQRAEEEQRRQRAEEERRAQERRRQEEEERQRAEAERRRKQEEVERKVAAQAQHAMLAQRIVGEAARRAADEVRRRSVADELASKDGFARAMERDEALENKRKETGAPQPQAGKSVAKRMKIAVNVPSSLGGAAPASASTSGPGGDEALVAKPASGSLAGDASEAKLGDRAADALSAKLGSNARSASVAGAKVSSSSRASNDSRGKAECLADRASGSSGTRPASGKSATEASGAASAPTSTSVMEVGWMAEGASCGRCARRVTDRGGVVCSRRRPDASVVGCRAGVCWRCMKTAQHVDFGRVKTTKAEFESLGDGAWWMHEQCMEPEDREAYFGGGDVDAAAVGAQAPGPADEDMEGRFAWE